MKGNADVIAALNKVLYNELIAINQYFLHSRMLKDWGLHKLGDKEYEESVGEFEYRESIDEMKHADALVERILFLDGLPNLQDLGKLLIGEDVREILECDLKLESNALPALREGIALAERESDYVSRKLLREILDSEEEHIDFLESQFELIDRMGIENYVQLQSSPAEA
jgi:bacterioferritin